MATDSFRLEKELGVDQKGVQKYVHENMYNMFKWQCKSAIF